MSDLSLALKLTADARQALAELKAMVAGTTDLKTAATVAAVELQKQSAATDASADSLAQAASLSAAAAQAMQTQTTALRGHTQSSGAAAAAAQNLAFQFNDVAMMAAAGQSPLQLAMQQGTQIAQVFGQAGASGAVGMLKAGFMAFLSPTTLVTVALVAGVAALAQWLMKANEAGVSTDEAKARLQEFEAAMTSFTSKTKQSQTSIGELRGEFGRYAEDMRQQAKYMADLDLAKANEAFAGVAQGLRADLSDLTEAQDKTAESARRYYAVVQGVKDGKLLSGEEDQALRETEAAQKDLTYAIEDTQKKLHLTGAEAFQLRDALNAMALATGPAQLADTSEKTLAILRQFFPAIKDAPEPIRDMVEELDRVHEKAVIGVLAAEGYVPALNHAANVAELLMGKLKDANAAVFGLSDGQPGEGFLSVAISQATKLYGILFATSSIHISASAESIGGTLTPTPTVGIIQPPPVNLTVPSVSTGTSAAGVGSSDADTLASLAAEGKAAMQALDDAVAAIDEKVKAGLVSTADAADGVASAKTTAADALAELIPRLDHLGPAGKEAADTWRGALGGLADQLKSVQSQTESLGKTMAEGFKQPFAEFLAGTKSASSAWDSFVTGINQTILQKLTSRFTDNILGPVLDSAFGGFDKMFGFAKGGVPGLSDLSGQVLDQPTMFAMPGGGLAQAGEAGAEAVMPLQKGPKGLSVTAVMGDHELLLGLTRGRDGKLGVALPAWFSAAMIPPQGFARGGVPAMSDADSLAPAAAIWGSGSPGAASGRGNTYISVVNNAKAEVKTTERVQGNDRFFDLVIDSVRHMMADDVNTGRGPLPQAMQGTYGLQRQGR